MKKLYNNILEAAGHDQEGELISIFAAGVVKCYGTNGNDTNPQYEECCESLISWNGKSFCFSANDACDFDVEEDRRSHLGFNVYLTKGRPAQGNDQMLPREYPNGDTDDRRRTRRCPAPCPRSCSAPPGP